MTDEDNRGLSCLCLTLTLLAILKAVAEKLIPGIPIQTRIAILQQTFAEAPQSTASESEDQSLGQLSVLETVVDRATSRNVVQKEIDGRLARRITFPCTEIF